MQYGRLGNSAIRVSCLGLGCMTMAGDYGVSDDREAIATIHRAIDEGVNFFDTADIYGRGSNENLLGRAIKERRDQVVVATKFGAIVTPDGTPGIDGRPDYVYEACESSLKRLEIDVIDLYYLHRVDPGVPVEDTVGAMAQLVKAGKVRAIGLSEASAATVRRAHAIHPLSALQSEYSLWCRDPEAEVLPTCRALGITFVAYAPLGRGFLTGGVKVAPLAGDRRETFPRFQAHNLRRNLNLLGPLERIAAAKGCTQAQVALAWLLSRGEDTVPIPGSKSRSHLEENIAASAIRLDSQQLSTLDRAFPTNAPVGERYGTAQAKYLNL